MAETERATSESSPAVVNGEAEATRLNQSALEFMFGAQRMLFEEMVFLGDEVMERTRTETHLLTEFVSKMAGAHSVKGIREMATECGQHQIDFIRRDSERIFAHGQRMVDATLKLATRQLDS